jgi:iron complex outermembrane recepter protein
MTLTKSRSLHSRTTMALMLATAALPLTTIAADQEVLDEVVVTGSRIARPNLTQPTPVTTLSFDELRMAGSPDLGQLLASLPALGSTGTLSGSSNSFDDKAGLNLPDLRRLGTSRTLTLVDGKRHVGGDPGTTAVDLGSIPISLVERVEIITGGASALYGSDAVSGVINVITRKDFEGVEVHAEMGDSWSRDYGSNYQLGLTLGSNFADERGNFTVTVLRDRIDDVQVTDLPQSREISSIANPANTGENDGIADRFVVPNIYGDIFDEHGIMLPNSQTSFSNSRGLIAFRNDGTPMPQAERLGSANFAFGEFPNGCATCLGFDDYLTIVPAITRTAFQTKARYELADPVSFYVDAKYVTSDIVEDIEPTTNTDLVINVADNPFLQEPLRAELLTAGETEVFMTRMHADAGMRRNNIERETKRIVAGLDGEFASGIGGISYDVFFNYGETNNLVRGQNRQLTNNFRAAIDAIRDPSGQIVCRDPSAATTAGCVPFNPFGQQNSPEAIAFSFGQTTEEQRLTQQNAGFSLVSDTSAFLNLPAGPIGWATGFEWREEKTSTNGDALVQAGLTEASADPDQDGGYKVSEAFMEVTVPLLADAFLADSLSIDAAFRAADYSHAGSANAWKLGASWAPIEQVRLRGTVAEAVRAPNIIEAFLPATPGFQGIDDPCDIGAINDDPDRVANCAALGIPPGFISNTSFSIDAENSGNSALDPEESDSFTFGVVYQPTWAPGLSITADYYDIEITDAIVAVDAQDIINNCVDASGGPDSDFCSLFTRDPVTQNINFVRSTYVNASKLETQGIDVELHYSKRLSDWTASSPLAWLNGTLTGSFSGTYLKELNQFVFQDRPDEVNIERGETGDPIHAYRALLMYQTDRFSIGWEATYVGSVKRYNVGVDICEDVSPCELDSSTIHDLNTRFFLPTQSIKVELYAGINNVTDAQPPYGIVGLGPDQAIYDALGRRYFVGVRSSF